MSTYPTISPDPMRQAFYETLRERGESHLFAEMLALQSPPTSQGTDRTFWEGFCNDSGIECKDLHDRYVKHADESGVSVTGKRYLGSLAKYPGDPKAWVSGVDDIKAVAKSRNLNVSGAVKHRGKRAERYSAVDEL